MYENAQICKLNFKNLAPRPHTGELPKPTSLDTPALRASLWAFGPSIVPQPEILDPPLAYPPSENTGYAYDSRLKT